MQKHIDRKIDAMIRNQEDLTSGLRFFSSVFSLVEESKRKRQERINAMTDEEYEEYIAKKTIAEMELTEKRRIKGCLESHKCPNNDDGQLIRGKKEKDNDYKRPFICNVCGAKWYKED